MREKRKVVINDSEAVFSLKHLKSFIRSIIGLQRKQGDSLTYLDRNRAIGYGKDFIRKVVCLGSWNGGIGKEGGFVIHH